MKKIVRISRVLCQILLVGALLVAFGCQKEVNRDKPIGKVSYNYFDTVSYVYDYTNDTEKEFEQFSNGVFDVLCYYHQLFDIYNDYSGINNLKTINDNAGIKPVEVDKDLIDFLVYCKQMYTLTSGKMNIMLGSVLRLWHNCRSEAAIDPTNSKIPAENELLEANKHTSIDNLIIDEEKRTVSTQQGKELAETYGMQFIETSAKSNTNVSEAFELLGKEIMKLSLNDKEKNYSNPNRNRLNLNKAEEIQYKKQGGCCAKK